MKRTIRWDSKRMKLFVDGIELSIRASQAIWNKSQDFNFGYGGSGQAQSALAILLNVAGKETALTRFQDFKRDFCSVMPADEVWMQEVDVEAWLALTGRSISQH